jgi:hypothetical protein
MGNMMGDEQAADGTRGHAAAFGDCDGKVSREDYISRAVLERISW